MQTTRLKSTERPTALGALLAVVVGLILTVVISELVLRVALPTWREFSSLRFQVPMFVPGYGTVYLGRPDFDDYFAQNDGDFRVHIKMNGFGLRNTEPVSSAHGRVWVVGDSMTFGWGVEAGQIYSKVAERQSGVPTYNVASSGTDACGYQAMIARMPDGLVPNAVVVGLVIENDVSNYQCARGKGPKQKSASQESLMDFNLSGAKVFLIHNSALYNFIAVELKQIDVVVEFLSALGLIKRPHAYRYHFDTSGSGARANSTADEIAHLKSMLPAGTPLAVLIVPARFDIRDGDAPFADLRGKVRAALSERGIEIIDPFPGFREAGFAATHFAHDGHWSPRGHEVAGKYLAAWLRKTLPRNGAGRARRP